MKPWNNVAITSSATIFDALKKIESGSLQICFVVDSANRLIGTVTDGDIRRALLKNLKLDALVETVMNRNPTTLVPGQSKSQILAFMKSKNLRQIPIVDHERKILGVEILEDVASASEKTQESWVVLMAGGRGTRLLPLTENTPKPMLNIGGQPLLETILSNFTEYGFKRIFISVNYKADVIKNYFGDGSRHGCEIRYLHEDTSLGTAGSLGLLPETPRAPIVVMNGDLLTKMNFQQLMDFHSSQGSEGTMGVREYQLQVPYGVVSLKDDRICSIDEKPIRKFFVNAGVYVLNPSLLSLVAKSKTVDMPELFQKAIEQEKKITPFPIREYWLDIGRVSDFERAQDEFDGVFR